MSAVGQLRHPATWTCAEKCLRSGWQHWGASEMRRRDFIALAGGAAAALPFDSLAQTAKVYRVGTLNPGPPLSSTADRGGVLFGGLAKRGYTLGQNLIH